jgi:hypothetical protein
LQTKAYLIHLELDGSHGGEIAESFGEVVGSDGVFGCHIFDFFCHSRREPFR